MDERQHHMYKFVSGPLARSYPFGLARLGTPEPEGLRYWGSRRKL